MKDVQRAWSGEEQSLFKDSRSKEVVSCLAIFKQPKPQPTVRSVRHPIIMLVFLFLGAACALGLGRPLVCTNSPPLQLIAGESEASAVYVGSGLVLSFSRLTPFRHDNPFGLNCRALLQFSDSDYHPISYTFNPGSACSDEIISFLVPLGAPNGPASIIW